MEIVPQAEVLKSKEHQTNQVSVYDFPINLDMNLQVLISSGKASYLFHIQNPAYKACIEFEIYEYSDEEDNKDLDGELNEFDQSQNFLYIISRMLYQIDKQKGFKDVTDKKVFDSYWSFVEEKSQITNDAENMYKILNKGKCIEFCAVGELSVFPNNLGDENQAKMVILNSSCILIIKK